MFSGVRVARARRIAEGVAHRRLVGDRAAAACSPTRRADAVRPPRRRDAARARGRSHELQFIGTGGGWVLLATAAASVGLFSWLHRLGRRRRRRTAAAVGRSPSSGATPPTAGATSAPASSAPPIRSPACSPCSARSRSGRRRSRWCCSGSLAHARCGDRRLVRRLPAHRARLAARGRGAALGGSHRRSSSALARRPPRRRASPTSCSAGWRSPVFGAATSWAAAATASLLFAAVIAAAPSLAPALVVGWIVALAVSGRAAVRLVGLPIPALVLALPLIVEQVRPRHAVRRCSPIPACPSAVQCRRRGSSRSACPSGGWGGWDELVRSHDLARSATRRARCSSCRSCSPRSPRCSRPDGAAPCSRSARSCSASPRPSRRRTSSVAIVGPDVGAVWAGAGLSLAWLGLVLAAVDRARRAAARYRP